MRKSASVSHVSRLRTVCIWHREMKKLRSRVAREPVIVKWFDGANT
jgi:hypothetical protein